MLGTKPPPPPLLPCPIFPPFPPSPSATAVQTPPAIDEVKHHAEVLPHSEISLQRALPRVHPTVVCPSVPQPGNIHEIKGRGFSPPLVHGVVVEVLVWCSVVWQRRNRRRHWGGGGGEVGGIFVKASSTISRMILCTTRVIDTDLKPWNIWQHVQIARTEN